MTRAGVISEDSGLAIEPLLPLPRALWREAWMSLNFDGSVTLAAAIGGQRMSSDEYFDGWQVEARAIECAIAT